MSEYEYDYDRVVDDADDLLEDEYDDFSNDYVNEREFDCYYHTLADELADE
jgi:hypothetical protein